MRIFGNRVRIILISKKQTTLGPSSTIFDNNFIATFGAQFWNGDTKAMHTSSLIGYGVAATVAGLAVFASFPARWILPSDSADSKRLASVPLETLDKKSPKNIMAGELWKDRGAVIMAVRRPGCLLCREEAASFAKIKPTLDSLNVPLYGIVHEKFGAEEFQPYLNAPVFFDSEKQFFGPRQRWMGMWGFMRPSVWWNIIRAKQSGFEGNMKGEGRLLGGAFVIGPQDQGVLYEHRESEWGDHANVKDVLEAVKRIDKKK